MHIKIPFRRKKPEPIVDTISTLATHDDIAKLEGELKEARRRIILANLTPRQKIRLKRMIAQRRVNEKEQSKA